MAAMQLTLLDDLPTSRCFAVDADGVIWVRFTTGEWGRGSLSPDRARHVFLRPHLAAGFRPLSLREHKARFFKPFPEPAEARAS